MHLQKTEKSCSHRRFDHPLFPVLPYRYPLIRQTGFSPHHKHNLSSSIFPQARPYPRRTPRTTHPDSHKNSLSFIFTKLNSITGSSGITYNTTSIIIQKSAVTAKSFHSPNIPCTITRPANSPAGASPIIGNPALLSRNLAYFLLILLSPACCRQIFSPKQSIPSPEQIPPILIPATRRCRSARSWFCPGRQRR